MVFREVDWKYLLGDIEEENCIPFIGSDICDPFFPFYKEIAKNLAERI